MWLCPDCSLLTGVHTHSRERSKLAVGQNENTLQMKVSTVTFSTVLGRSYAVVGLQIINLFLEHHHPYVLAKKLYHIQMVCESWSVS